MDCAFTPCYRSRLPASGRSGYRYQCSKNNPAKEIAKLRVQLNNNMRVGSYEPNMVKSQHVSNEDEEMWESETEEEKRKRWNAGVYWPFEKANLEKKLLEEEKLEESRLEKKPLENIEGITTGEDCKPQSLNSGKAGLDLLKEAAS